ncbi:hypothetical protein PS683_04890 [Pseudomonas fluorescens]|uniref:HEPN AbiJ-N-terminal domain-containing protein n=1 Tax=Pseudomonas fluorescens TaxID=294 RepID=A0A5E6WRG2_PSEFL|nr:hypothetical protein PS683_04890 [Pseudomonas fluorescens]VVN31180.1 hypothetical protein PS683_04890 [Pseudomonas fluorescens]
MPDNMNHLSFSQRMGLVPAIKVAQVDSIDPALKNSLWNVVTIVCLSGYYSRDRNYPDRLRTSNFSDFAETLYSDFHKAAVDTIPSYWSKFKGTLRENYYKMSWHRTYSFIEFIVTINHRDTGQALIDGFNKVLARENSAYRFVAGRLIQITSPDEIEEIERAIANSDQYAGVRTHLQTALGFLTDKLNPDYRNSIKESISAVESLAKHLVGNPSATLDGALKVLEKSHKLHPALKKAFSSLYGYTNDSDGIRHALMENSELTQADARFMLICCSAFTNFAIDSTKS